MDEFEKEYFTQLKQIGASYPVDRQDLAKSRIKMIVAALTRQLIDDKENFDLLIGAGNSGLFMTTIAKMVYEKLGINLPPVVTLPIFRFREVDGKLELNDNSVLGHLLKEQLSSLPDKPNILFVDDEIYMGFTVKASLELLLSEYPNIESVRCTVIAENHFFEWHHKMPKVSLNFFSHSRLIQGLKGNIGYFIPEDLFTEIKNIFPDVESYNHAMGIVIGGALKRKDNVETPIYDKSVIDLCLEKIPDFASKKENLMKELEELVNTGIEDYKNKTIQFRF